MRALEAELEATRGIADLALAEIRVVEQRWAKLYSGLGENLQEEITTIKRDLLEAKDHVWALTVLLGCLAAAISLSWLFSSAWSGKKNALLLNQESDDVSGIKGGRHVKAKALPGGGTRSELSGQSGNTSCLPGSTKPSGKRPGTGTSLKATTPSTSTSSSGTRASELSLTAVSAKRQKEISKPHGGSNHSNQRENGTKMRQKCTDIEIE